MGLTPYGTPGTVCDCIFHQNLALSPKLRTYNSKANINAYVSPQYYDTAVPISEAQTTTLHPQESHSPRTNPLLHGSIQLLCPIPDLNVHLHPMHR
jgi:hypothetical protein